MTDAPSPQMDTPQVRSFLRRLMADAATVAERVARGEPSPVLELAAAATEAATTLGEHPAFANHAKANRALDDLAEAAGMVAGSISRRRLSGRLVYSDTPALCGAESVKRAARSLLAISQDGQPEASAPGLG